MIYKSFLGDKLSALGFGTMRLPVKEDGRVDEEKTFALVDEAIKGGVNYFDTAYPYHGGESETVIGKALARYPRESFRLATKYPGHQYAKTYDPAEIFEEQLIKCGVDYFDYYLLHNVNENSLPVYSDERWKIVDYFKKQKELGRIRHLGFSSHGDPENLRESLKRFGKDVEFCQIQLNPLDWELQRAKEKIDILSEYGMPVWVMEPVRGGKLASFSPETEAVMKAARPSDSIAAWSFRWALAQKGVTVILSGMSNLEQMQDNIKTFSDGETLSAKETAILEKAVEGLKNSVPCTACHYCVDGCPAGLDIPRILSLYNDMRVAQSVNVAMRVEALGEKNAAACIACGKCRRACPQKIDVPAAMKDFTERLSATPTWREICREREEAAERRRKERERKQ